MKKILSLVCLLMLAMTSAWADDVKVTWALGGSTDAVAEPDGYATGAITIGEGLSNEGEYTWSDIAFTKFQSTSEDKGTNSHSSAESMKKYVDFSLTPVGGKFTPTKVSFDIIKIGTGDPAAFVDFIDGEGNTITVKDNATIRRNQDGTDAISHSYSISGAKASENAATLRILVGKLANNKQVGIANVIIEGIWTSSAKTVTFINDANWETVNVYAWDENNNPITEAWPGTTLTAGADGNYTWSTTAAPAGIIFNNGTAQTADLDFKDGGVYNSQGRIITLKDFSATFTTDGMDEVWAYAWNDDEEPLGEWPGTKMEGGNGEFSIAIQAEEAPAFIIFHNNAGQQTEDIPFVDGMVYEYMMNTYTATFKTDTWKEVYAYAWNVDGENAVELAGAYPGQPLTAENGIYTFSIKGFSAPENILFNNGGSGEGNQTGDYKFVDGKAYQYMTATPLYTIAEGTVFTAGQTVEVKDGNLTVATITYSEEGGNDFNAATTELGPVEGWAAFAALTTGNETNGDKEYGTFYIIKPVYDGTITVGVRLNSGKKFHIAEDGTDLPAYNGWTIPEAASTNYSFDVKAGSTYKIWCDGSKLGFYGFDYKYEKPALNTYTAKFENNGNWAEVYAYAWTTTGEGEEAVTKEFLGAWPGTKIEPTDEGYVVTIEAEEAPAMIIFNNGDQGLQTEDLVFEDGKTYTYVAPAQTATFDFTDPNIRENIGTAMSDVAGYIYNETFVADGTTLQITAGSAPSRIYTDGSRGQCLVTYKEYTTLTFRAPEGKAITKIEFTKAGNSNIKNFTASSGAIEEMTWTGHATGVRFLQGGTSYLANAIVTLEDATPNSAALPEIEYTECANIAAFNALEPGTYAKLTLTDAEVIAKSGDGYSTVFIQDDSAGAWIQYTSLNDKLQEMTKLNGVVYTVKRFANNNPQLKETEDTPKSEFSAEAINELTIIEGTTIADVNIPENLNRVVKFNGATLEETSNSAGTLYLGEEQIAVNNGALTNGNLPNQLLYKIKDWAEGTKLENITIVAILSAKSSTENQLLPISIEIVGETEAGEELNIERYPGMGYSTTTASVDLTAAKEFLGVEELATSMLSIINPDGTEVSNYNEYDGWFNIDGAAETWQSLNQEGNVRPGINVKFFEAIPNGDYTICDMNGVDVIGNVYTVRWALKANGKTYTYTINVTFVEPPVVELAKSDLEIVASVEYPANCGSYEPQTVTLSEEQVQSILAELGLESLVDANVYGYNPTTGELLSNYAGFDGWRDVNGDFAMHSGAPTVPACVKYDDGQNYYCYSIAGCEPQTIKTYWAIANSEKYVLVEIDFVYTEPVAIEREIVDLGIKTSVTYDVNEASYTEKVVSITEEQLQQILTELGLGSIADEACQVFVYNPTTKELANEGGNDGWRDANGDTHVFTGDATAPVCVKFVDGLNYSCFNLQGMEAGTTAVFWAIANATKAVLVEIDFIYEGVVDGINAITAAQNGEAIYNLQGVRLNKLQKGLNIVGGKKIVVK